jgi:hypothetical protein
MKKYYIDLVTFAGIFSADYSRAYWGMHEKKKLKATSLSEAKEEGRRIFTAHRTFQLSLVDHRFTKEHKQKLINTFPDKMKIIEEIEHSVSV